MAPRLSEGPIRTCVGCRTRSSAGSLVRVARRADGSLVVDGNAPGRGAWLCRDPVTGGIRDRCLEAATRQEAFRRAFRAAVDPASWPALRAHSDERANMDTSLATRRDGSRRD